MAINVINNKILCKFAAKNMNQHASDIEKTTTTPGIDAPEAIPAYAEEEMHQSPESTGATDESESTESAWVSGSDTGKPGLKVCAWLGAIVTLGAWLALIFSGTVSFCLAAVGIVLSSFGARCRRGLVRDMAITAIVASAVLILVFAIFFGALLYLDKTLG